MRSLGSEAGFVGRALYDQPRATNCGRLFGIDKQRPIREELDNTREEERPMHIASRGATMAVDWEQRIDYPRLRAERLERARASLRGSSLGAVLLFDQN